MRLQLVTVTIASSGGDSELTGLAGWVAEVVRALDGPGVGALIALENLFPPIPSEVVLPLAGFLAGRDELGLVSVLAWALVGSMVGAVVLYALGASLGKKQVCAVVDRIPLMSADDVEKAERWFDRYGELAVLIARVIPGARSLISLPAGFTRMPIPRFLLLTALGSAVWNAALVFAGYVLGASWRSVGRYSDWINYALLAALAAAVLFFVVRRLRERRRE